MTAPDVAVTVTVDVTGVPTPTEGAPALAEGVPEEWPLQPVIRVNATTLKGKISTICRPRRLLLRTNTRAIARDEPENKRPAAAEAWDVVTVSVETISPVDVAVAGPKAQVAPLGRPEHVKLTGEVEENPFCGVSVTVVVPLVPAVSVRAVGETARVKSGAGAPLADVMALA
jgi:hypothetical protein